MTTTNDELEDRIALLGPGQTEEGKVNINEAVEIVRDCRITKAFGILRGLGLNIAKR